MAVSHMVDPVASTKPLPAQEWLAPIILASIITYSDWCWPGDMACLTSRVHSFLPVPAGSKLHAQDHTSYEEGMGGRETRIKRLAGSYAPRHPNYTAGR